MEFPLEAAFVAVPAGNLISQNTAGTGWVFLPLPRTSEATETPVLPCAGGCDTTAFPQVFLHGLLGSFHI